MSIYQVELVGTVLNSKFLISIDSWISALESDSMEQADDSHAIQNILPPKAPPYSGVLGARPTQAHGGGQVGAAQSDWNFSGPKATPTARKEKNHFYNINIIESNAQSTEGNTSSNNQESPDNTNPLSPVPSAQGSVNGNSGTPSSGNNGVSSPAPVTSPSQVVGNQGNEVPGANSAAPATSPSQVGGTPSSGTNGANGPAPVSNPSEVASALSSGTNAATSQAPVSSPNQLVGNQGKEVSGAVSPSAGGAINPNNAGGATAGSSETLVGVPTNKAQPNGAYL